ncbi:synaptonemal complex protein 2-like [Diplodia corticola]|uniref:Synaptonemal complex protein 2-like n=1 Tax=Diplodia corticola TaxID=236234 RepID=A0A1J9R305_9PEZI|nr:synaptonemal complex protein 2-like [Diplodia corticola]OJD34610.1 synaptonemal complex protein 2-like [Diplodia corticola]
MPELSHVVGALKDSPRSNFTGVLQQRASRPGQRWTKRELQPRLESATVEGMSSKECRAIQYRTLLADLMCYNHTVAAKDRPEPGVVAKKDDKDWLLADLSDGWIRRLETHAGQELQRQKEEDAREQYRRILDGQLLSQVEWGRIRARNQKMERAANKKMWEECKTMTLGRWKDAAGFDYTDKVQELLDLQAFHDIQKAELNTHTETAQSLVAKAILTTESLATAADSCLDVLENQTETTECLLDLSEQSMLRAHTRVRRLMATDVEGEVARKEEMRRRLEHPKALDYMFEGKTELEAARAVANSTRRFLESIEEDLEKTVLATVDTISSLKDARLALDFQ